MSRADRRRLDWIVIHCAREERMQIALDYDDTFTNDETLWRAFVSNAIDRGHSVAFVTSRQDDGDNIDIMADAKALRIPVVFCNHKAKSECYTADVWIDDNPLMIPSRAAIRLCAMEPRQSSE